MLEFLQIVDTVVQVVPEKDIQEEVLTVSNAVSFLVGAVVTWLTNWFKNRGKVVVDASPRA